MAYLEREYPPADRRNEDNFTLYVGNLPEELNKEGIAQIFQDFGEIRLLSPVGATWAYVTYNTYKEAEHAIRALNNRSPLYLKVAFQQKKRQQKSQHYSSGVVGPSQENLVNDFRYSETGLASDANARSFVPGILGAHFPLCARYNHESDENSVYPNDLDHNIYNPFESVGRYAETNAMWSRGCVNVDDYGKRYVSMGRGFTRYHIPEPHPNQEQQIGRVYEKRRAGLYEYGDDRLQSRIGKCLLCRRVSTLQCEQCAGFYCSRECQIADWSRHKIECKTIPGLVGGLEVASISRSSSDEQLLVPRKPGGMDLRALGVLRRPKTVVQIDVTAADRKPLEQNSVVEDPKCAPPMIDFSQPSPQQNSFHNFEYNEGMQKISNGPGRTYNNRNDAHHHNQNRRHDENSNDRYKTNARQQVASRIEQNGFKNDQRSANQIRENNRPFNKSENYHSGKEGNNSNAGSKEVETNVAQSEGMSNQAKTDLMKMEEELGFQRDPRAQINVKKQTPLKTPPLTRPENVRRAEPTDSLISETAFTDVMVVYPMSDGTFWVHRKKDGMTIVEMMKELQTKAQCYPAATELVIGEMYAVKYNDVWHRATLISKNPPSIFYIDFGNEEPPQSKEFRSLTDFPNYPPYAIRMRLSADANVKSVEVDSELSVKMISVDRNRIVEVVDDGKTEGVVAAPSETPKTAPPVVKALVTQIEVPKAEATLSSTPNVAKAAITLPNMIDNLKTNDGGFIEVYMALNNNSYAGCVLTSAFTDPYQMLYETMIGTCNATAQPTNFKPQIGDFVCGKRETVWLRGYVFSLGPPIRLALVDEARVSPVEQVLPMPAEYAEICSFGTICTLEAPGSGFDVGEAAEFRVTGVETVTGERVVKAVVIRPEHLKDVSIRLQNWSPTPEQKGIGFAELKTNSEVCITAYTSERIMFVRSLDTESLERTRRITQEVAKWAQKAPMLDGPPAIGQLVIARFTDGNFYRAIVTKLCDEKIGVSYVDYGNRDFTTIDQLRLLSDELKGERSCAAKVVLKDIKADVPPTQEVHQYLNLLVGKEQPLFCTFEGIPSKDGVILTAAMGECVNLKVNEYLTPAWQREDPAMDTKCFTMADLEYAKFGEIGKTADALVLYASDAPFTYFMCPYDQEHISHVTLTMAKMIQDYCESTKLHYIPRVTELCLAVYEGSWYRGLCLNPSETPTQARINFIDFGNIEVVDHTNIRQMTKDFISPAALGCICEVKNLGIELVDGRVPENIKTRLDALIPLNTIVDVKIVRKLDEGEYEVEMPRVRQKLVEEGLVKSL